MVLLFPLDPVYLVVTFGLTLTQIRKRQTNTTLSTRTSHGKITPNYSLIVQWTAMEYMRVSCTPIDFNALYGNPTQE